jgi:hypothetical protein
LAPKKYFLKIWKDLQQCGLQIVRPCLKPEKSLANFFFAGFYQNFSFAPGIIPRQTLPIQFGKHGVPFSNWLFGLVLQQGAMRSQKIKAYSDFYTRTLCDLLI